MAAWTQTLGRDYKTCIVKEDLCASSKRRTGVDDDPLLDRASARGGELGIGGRCWGDGCLGLVDSKLRERWEERCFLTNTTLEIRRLTSRSGRGGLGWATLHTSGYLSGTLVRQSVWGHNKVLLDPISSSRRGSGCRWRC